MKRQELYARVQSRKNLERKRLLETGTSFVERFPQYIEKARSNHHAKFLLGQKGGSDHLPEKMMRQYSR